MTIERKVHLVARRLLLVTVKLGLVMGSVFAAVLTGAVVCYLLKMVDSTLPVVSGTLAALAVFAAGFAGWQHVVGWLESWTAPEPDPEDDGGDPL